MRTGGGSFGRLSVHVGEDWRTHLSTYEDHSPILSIDASSTSVALSIQGHEVTEAAVTFARDLADQAAILIQGGGPVLRGMRDYFERLWKIAVPFGEARSSPGCPLGETQMQILQLMAAGNTDQSIAGILGCSKSTIEREMDKVEEIIGLKGRRFALGVALERRGWVPRGKATMTDYSQFVPARRLRPRLSLSADGTMVAYASDASGPV
jgi:DNA-binding CsgD family transcriptional regulator